MTDKSSPQKIGILGGTFNPIHNGHIKIALLACEQLNLDEVLLIPSGISYQKKSEDIAAPENRLAMTALAASEFPRLTAADIELRRPGNSYSYETVRQLKELYPGSEIYFIVGADTLYNMESWKNPEDIFKNAVIAVAGREHIPAAILKEKAGGLTEKYGAKIRRLPPEEIAVSSRLIRQRLKNGEAISDLVPAKVAEYIAKAGLYGGISP